MNNPIKITESFLNHIGLVVGDHVSIGVFRRTKYGGEKSGCLYNNLYKIYDVSILSKFLHALRAIYSDDESVVVYLTPCPRNVEKASKEAVKVCIDKPDQMIKLQKMITSNAQKYPIKDRVVMDADVDVIEAVKDVREVFAELEIPLLAEVTTRGGAHFLFQPRNYPSHNTHTVLIDKFQQIEDKYRMNDGKEVVSLKRDRFVPVPGTLQGNHLVTWTT